MIGQELDWKVQLQQVVSCPYVHGQRRSARVGQQQLERRASSRDSVPRSRVSRTLIFPLVQRYLTMAICCSHLYTSLTTLVSRAVKRLLRKCFSERLAFFFRHPLTLLPWHVLRLCHISTCFRREVWRSTLRCTCLSKFSIPKLLRFASPFNCAGFSLAYH